MHHLEGLSSGYPQAANGVARILVRGTSIAATYYTDFEASSSSTADVALDSRGQAEVYVNQVVDVRLYSSTGAFLKQMTVGSNASAVEVISDSVLGADYEDAEVDVNEPTTLKALLDLWITQSGGAPMWKVDPFGTGTYLPLSTAIGLGQGGEFNVKKYGALGDGTTNDTAAITNAISAAEVDGGVVVFPAGTFKITSALTIPEGVSLRGAGSSASILVISSATLGALIFNSTESTGSQGLSGLTVRPDQANSGDIVKMDDGSFFITNCTLGSSNCTGTVLDIGSTTAAKVHMVGCILMQGGGTASCVSGGATASFLMANSCEFTIAASGAASCFMAAAIHLVMADCIFNPIGMTSGTSYGVVPAGGGSAQVSGCRFGAPTGGTFSGFGMFTGVGALRVSEAGNTFGNITPYALTLSAAELATSVIGLGSRPFQWAQVDNDTAGAQTVDALTYGEIIWRRTTNGTQTPTLAVAPIGTRFSLYWWNDHGAGGGTITLASASGAIRSEFASEQFTVAANSIRLMTFKATVINGNFRWVQDGESTDDETE